MDMATVDILVKEKGEGAVYCMIKEEIDKLNRYITYFNLLIDLAEGLNRLNDIAIYREESSTMREEIQKLNVLKTYLVHKYFI